MSKKNNDTSVTKKEIIKKPLKRLDDVPYKGSKKTVTQSLTAEEINDLLDGYEEVEFENIKKMHNIRYFKENIKTGGYDFRVGGIVLVVVNIEAIEKTPAQQYIVLNANGLNWSVQKEGNVFYQAMPISKIKEQIHAEYKQTLVKQNDKIKEFISYARTLENTIKEKNKEIGKLKQNK